jgi:hypothetical protein
MFSEQSNAGDSIINRVIEQGQPRRKISCFLCGKSGQIVRNCFQNPSFKRESRFSEKKKVREVSKEQEEVDKDDEENKIFKSYKVKSVVENSSSLWIKVRIHETTQEIKCLLDSGADVNLFKASVIKSLVKISKC